MNNEVKELVDKLNYHTKLYDEGNPIISDKEWDDMYFKLVKLERITGIYLPDSPTQRINYQIVNELKKVEHSHKMLSLPKTKDPQEVIDFIGDKPFIAMPKYDGLTCSLTYENGYLILAETRGDGTIGEDITHNAMVIPTIPKKINYTNRLVVDGEIVCSYKDFEKFSSDYKNPRNFAAGSIRLLDAKECSTRKLDFIAWEVIEGLDEFRLLSTRLEYLFTLGFKNSAFNTNNFITIKQFIENTKDKDGMHHQIKYPTDGLVFKFDEVEYGKSLGETAHHFNNAIRYKFYDEEYDTNIKYIEWDVGRTGVLTPVAVFEPIEIDGTIVERASLHNISILKELGLKYQGQKIEVRKAKQIIPQVVRAFPYDCEISSIYRMGIPDICPVCGGRTEIKKDNDTEFLFCTNPDCSGKIINKLDHFCSKKGLDIKGLSKTTLEKLLEWGYVNNITDIFTLYIWAEKWVNKPGFGHKSVEKILDNINASKTDCEPDKFIAALGIPLVGTTVSKEIIKHFKTYENFRNSVDANFDFTTIKGFGPEIHKAIVSFDYAEADNIVEKFLTFKNENGIIISESNKLKDLNFVITGSLNQYKNRDELKTIIEHGGGKVVGSVSKNTNYLINNDINSNSSKNSQAKKLNIPIISELEFIEKFLTL